MKALYFVAIVAPEPVFSEVRSFQEDAARMFDTRRALHSPPHITLVPPFNVSDEQVPVLHATLEALTLSLRAFDVELDGFGAFPPRVIYVKVRPAQVLTVLAEEVFRSLRKVHPQVRSVQKPFRPHMTVAFKDLSRSMFSPAWKWFGKIEYRRAFSVKSVILLVHREGLWTDASECVFPEI